MNAEILIFGGQIIAGALIVYAAGASRRQEERAERIAEKKEEGRGAIVDILSDAWKKATRRGVSGYDRSLGICALTECISRIKDGEDVDPGVISLSLEYLGLHLEQDEDGIITVCEN